jgi:tripartite-type tricarboxylate transporter receptor subunit TctC
MAQRAAGENMTKCPVASVCALSLIASSLAAAQAFPTKPIRLIVPYAPGGSPDITSRLVAHELSLQLGQQVVVDNRAGAGGIIGTELIARAPADGYTLGYIAFGFATNPHLFTKLPYDTHRDFQHIALMLTGLNLLAVSPSMPVRSVKELIEHARANPGKLSYGSTGSGVTNTLAMEMFKSMTGTQLISVPYKAAQQAIGDVAAGRVDSFCDNMPSILPHARAGRVRGIAVTSLKRTAAAPDIPTVDESGVRGFELLGWSGFSYQSRTPRDIVLRMNAEINRALATANVVDKLTSFGYTPGGGTPTEFGEFIRKEIDKWGKVIRTAGIKPQQ